MRSALHSAIAMTALMAQSTFAAGDHAKGKVASPRSDGSWSQPVLGPELNGIWGRLAASVPNHTKFRRIRGIPDAKERADIIAYLKAH
jgi:cytochrome c2